MSQPDQAFPPEYSLSDAWWAAAKLPSRRGLWRFERKLETIRPAPEHRPIV